MTTLIAVYSGTDDKGHPICVGRCDAKCYEAQHHHCECICGGLNHGAGLSRAIDQTRELAETWIEDYKLKHGLNGDTKSYIAGEVQQLSLFGETT